MCSPCVVSLEAGRKPKFSIANGYDYGRMERLPELEPLTIVETYLISLVRLYITVFKLLAPSGDPNGTSCLKGHTICFPHDGPVAAAKGRKNPESFPWTEDVLDFVSVRFIGTNNQYDNYLKHNFHCNELRIRNHVVYNWITVLKAVNPLYSSIIIDDSPNAVRSLQNLEERLRRDAQLLSDPESIDVENIIGSDAAGVRWHVSEGDRGIHSTNGENTAILNPMLVTDRNGVEWLVGYPQNHWKRKAVFSSKCMT